MDEDLDEQMNDQPMNPEHIADVLGRAVMESATVLKALGTAAVEFSNVLANQSVRQIMQHEDQLSTYTRRSAYLIHIDVALMSIVLDNTFDQETMFSLLNGIRELVVHFENDMTRRMAHGFEEFEKEFQTKGKEQEEKFNFGSEMFGAFTYKKFCEAYETLKKQPILSIQGNTSRVRFTEREEFEMQKELQEVAGKVIERHTARAVAREKGEHN